MRYIINYITKVCYYEKQKQIYNIRRRNGDLDIVCECSGECERSRSSSHIYEFA